MHAHIHVSEEKPPEDVDTPMSFTMEGFNGKPPSEYIPYFWAPGWNSDQSVNKYQVETGGPLHDGDPGRRLIEPDEQKNIKYFEGIPEAFGKIKEEKDNGQIYFQPLHQIFGSEELSVHSPGLAERIPEPYVLISEDDGEMLGLNENEFVSINLENNDGQLAEITLAVRKSGELEKGCAGIPVGLPNMPFFKLPGWGMIKGGENE